MIDDEIRNLVDKAESKCKKILQDNIEELHIVAKGLLEYETLTGDEINDLILASASTKERRIEMIDMGNSFRKIMKDSWELSLADNTAFVYCVGKAALHFKINFNDLIKFYLQSYISNLINVCVKHIPISQKDGQTLNVRFIDQIQKFLNQSKKLSLKDIGTTFFVADIFAFKHENLDSRIYLT